MSDLLNIKLVYEQDRMASSEQQKARNAPSAPSTQELVFSKAFYQIKAKSTQPNLHPQTQPPQNRQVT